MHIKYMQTYVLIYKLANEKMFFTPNFDKTNQYSYLQSIDIHLF